MAGLDWLQAGFKADPSDDATAVIYFSSHGHVDPGSYDLVPYNFDHNRTP